MDWLFERRDRIEKKLANRHLKKGGRVLYDLSSSYFEGRCRPLAAYGHNRDGKKGKPQVNYGLLTDARGCPVSISAFPGNTSDSGILIPQVKRLRKNFNLRTPYLQETQLNLFHSDWLTFWHTYFDLKPPLPVVDSERFYRPGVK